jgi:ligand-binding sensor protein
MEVATNHQAFSTSSFREVNFNDIFKIEEIQILQDLFADTHGVASIITTTDGTPITNPSNYLTKRIFQHQVSRVV